MLMELPRTANTQPEPPPPQPPAPRQKNKHSNDGEKSSRINLHPVVTYRMVTVVHFDAFEYVLCRKQSLPVRVGGTLTSMTHKDINMDS